MTGPSLQTWSYPSCPYISQTLRIVSLALQRARDTCPTGSHVISGTSIEHAGNSPPQPSPTFLNASPRNLRKKKDFQDLGALDPRTSHTSPILLKKIFFTRDVKGKELLALTSMATLFCQVICGDGGGRKKLLPPQSIAVNSLVTSPFGSPNSIIDCDLSSLHFHPLYLFSTPPPLPRLAFTHLGRCSAKCRVAVTFQTCSILLHSEMSTTSPSPLKPIPIPIPLKIPVTLSSRTSWRDKGLQFLLSARSRLLSLSSANTLSKRPALQFLCT